MFNGQSSISVFSNKEGTLGSRYYFNRWVKGKVVNNNNELVNSDGYYFNYDKMAKKFLATTDKTTVIDLDDTALLAIELLEEDADNSTFFEKVSSINEGSFFIRLANTGGKYALYKSIDTRFRIADYKTNGLIESGKNYDEFVDNTEYYVLISDQPGFKKVRLNYKNIKEVFKSDLEKFRHFTSEHDNDDLNELYLTKLVLFMNGY